MVSLHEIDVINSRSQGFLALFAGTVLGGVDALMLFMVMSILMVALCTIVNVGDMTGSEVIFCCAR